jgi:hypothetical protein
VADLGVPDFTPGDLRDACDAQDRYDIYERPVAKEATSS